MTVSRYKFLYPEWREVNPKVWVDWWAGRYGDGDNPEYFKLIAEQGALSTEDFELVGRWKEGCLKPNHGGWKTGTPRGYDVWMQAKAEMPRCPDEDSIAGFLKNWCERPFAAGKNQMKRFGLARATTLLHFISGGRYPILDSRVITAMTRLGSPIEETVEGYSKSFCPAFLELASICGVFGVEGLRKLDNALFCYGVETSFPSVTRSM